MATQKQLWQPHEEHILRLKYTTHTAQQIHELYLPNRSTVAIRAHAAAIGLAVSRPTSPQRPWSQNELDLMEKYYTTMPVKTFQQTYMPYRKLTAIMTKAKTLGLKHKRSGSQTKGRKGKRKTETVWTKSDLKILHEFYGKIPSSELQAKLPNKTETQIRTKAYFENLTRDYGWTDDENQILRDNAPSMTAKELAELLPERPLGTIYAQIKALGIERPKHSHKPSENGRKRWTEHELTILRENRGKPIKKIQELLPGRTAGAIMTKLCRM